MILPITYKEWVIINPFTHGVLIFSYLYYVREQGEVGQPKLEGLPMK
jgi:hypothetical protein